MSNSNNPRHEAKENNEFETSLNSLHFSLPRTPLNSITDPSQLNKDSHDSDFGKIGNNLSANFTPRVLNRHGKAQLEQNSAPGRSGARVSIGGVGIARSSGSVRGREGSWRVLRGNYVANSDCSVEVPSFELDEDSLFWSDNNVQVLIRIRPLSSVEKVSQGCGRCLRQESGHTLEWLGHPETRFTFDHIAGETISQEKLFKVAGLPMVENCMSGYNSCMFAYGQTGSGKTHTMMGEIKQTEGMLSEDSGITPRVYEYLFSRIRMEEESRRDENLKFSCKCSFLEIYNEQITDLLVPSSTNLQLREDLKKGVYVENLTEYNVRDVKDVIKLLLQGAANRKIAATNMNSESSRSHSVFTCTVESCWERDSVTHFRFSRLNLVDLAGSERQKSSGAEGDRLREAANINKSLSTLGLVIMSLVDLAHGKQRHVPYRDSRLTFLLQDSLGGNSKTTIIANVSPSICSAHETLSTLKFAQRAKLIQNNAKVNEDASGDVGALHQQIQQLKDQLSFLMKHNNLPSLEVGCKVDPDESGLANFSQTHNFKAEKKDAAADGAPINWKMEMKRMESVLLGALRREQLAETSLQKLDAEIRHLNSLDCKREEDMQHIKMMLRFREEKIKQLELLVDGSLSADAYLMEENKALKEEIHLLHSRIDRSPELTKFALQNMKLADQLESFKTFYEQGERDTLLVEISDLRDQLLGALEREPKFSSRVGNQDNNSLTQMEDCRNMNSKLMREVDELQQELGKYLEYGQAAFDPVIDCFSKDPEEIRNTDKYSMVESESTCNSGNETCSAHTESENSILHDTGYQNEQNHPHVEILNKDNLRKSLLKVSSDNILLNPVSEKQGLLEGSENSTIMNLQAKLEKLTEEFEEASLLNCQYMEDQASQLSHQSQVELVREQVEIETSRTILHLQDEITALHLELNERLCYMNKENLRLQNDLATKEDEMRILRGEWEKAILELTSFLLEGSKSLKDASNQIENIVCSFPQRNDWICEHVERAARACIGKEETILVLQRSLEDAQGTVNELEMKLNSLKEATIALNLPQLDNATSTRNQKTDMEGMLERKLMLKEEQIIEAKKLTDVAFLVLSFLFNREKAADSNDVANEVDNHSISEKISDKGSLSIGGIEAVTEFDGLLQELVNSIEASHRVLEADIKGLQMDLVEASVTDKKLVQDLVKEIEEIKNNFVEVRENGIGSQACESKLKVFEPVESLEFKNQLQVLHQIKDELTMINERVKFIEDSIKKRVSVHNCLSTDECSIEADGWSVDESTSGYSTSGSDSSSEIVSSEKSHCSSPVISCLAKELDKAFDSFSRIYACLSKVLDKHGNTHSSSRKEVKPMSLSSGLTTQKDAACCHCINEEVTVDKSYQAGNFLDKCEAVHGIMKEADDMLNALLKANENATQLSGKWKQASEELMVQRSCLVEENKQLKYSMNLKERENTLLLEELCRAVNEATTSLSSLEECFLQMQKEVEDRFQILYSDTLAMGRDMMSFICNSRTGLEDICSELIEKGYFSNVIYLYLLGEIHNIPCFNVKKSLYPFKEQQWDMSKSSLANLFSSDQDEMRSTSRKDSENVNQGQISGNLTEESLSHDILIEKNSSLKKELERKELLLKGLLFDFSLLQEVASSKKDVKDETEKLVLDLNDVQQKLEMKTCQFDDLLVQHEEVESHLQDIENALRLSNSELEQAKEMINALSDQNSELEMLQKDLYAKKSEAEEKLKEEEEVIKGLENQIIHFTSLVDGKFPTSVESLEEDLRKITDEKEQLQEEIRSLNDKLQMAYALVDENEAIAVEARQDSEASKMYAEQKEEEVKILEHSVEELECTINVLEKKVYEMDEEVEKYRLIRDSLEVELQALRQRLSTVENLTDFVHPKATSPVDDKDPMSRQPQTRVLELTEAHKRIKFLEKNIVEKDKEIKQCKDYISELVLHSEAQALQYQEKYKTLEAMVLEVKTNLSNPISVESTVDKFEKSSMRTRGSSSPFRCISNLVQQLNLEKDQELSAARHRIEELEGLLAGRQKDVCMLNARLATAESMTHDVIRDLLGVKLEMTNYANMIDQHQVQKLVEEAYQQKEEFAAKEHEILTLRKQIDDLVEERESCISELRRKGADVLAVQMTLEQFQDRNQLLSAQNEMLKVDKSNLLKTAAELDEMVNTLLGRQSSHQRVPLTQRSKDKDILRLDNGELSKKLAHSESLLSRVNNELALYRRASISHPQEGVYGRSFEAPQRK